VKLPSSRVYGGWLALARLLTGASGSTTAFPSSQQRAVHAACGCFATYLQNGIGKTMGPYHDFLVNTVAPNAALFAELVRFGEACVGISLLLGLFSRVGGSSEFFCLSTISPLAGLGTFNGGPRLTVV